MGAQASQNVPGVAAVMRAAGYGATPVSPLTGWTGATTLLLFVLRRW